MTLVLLEPPVNEPVTLAETKLFLRVDHNDEDTLIATLIAAARLHVEAATGQVLISQKWRYIRDDWPRGGVLDLPISPLRSIDEVVVFDADGNPETLAATDYVADIAGRPTRIAFRAGFRPPHPGQPINGIEINLTGGYGADPDDVPAPIRAAMLQLIAHWFDRRAPVAFGAEVADVPAGIASLLGQYRAVRL